MAAPSDAVVIGIILTLVFSAAIYYIYTLLQQLEGKVNVLNTIIFELKKTNEHYMNMYDGGGYESSPLETFSMLATEKVPQEVALQESVDAHDDGSIPMDFESAVASSAVAAEIPYTADEKKADAPEETISTSLLSANYESMTYKELKAEAKRKHIKGSSTLTKQELIDALKQLDAGAEPQGIAVNDNFQSLTEEEFVPNFDDVINLN